MKFLKAKLYKKILLSFLAVFIIALLLIMAMFSATAGKDFSEAVTAYSVAKTAVARDLVQDHLDQTGVTDLESSLKLQTDKLSRYYRAKVWLETDQGRIIAQSGEGSYEGLVKKLTSKPSRMVEGIEVWCSLKRGWDTMTAASLRLPGGQTGRLRILFFPHGKRHPGPAFALGLLAVGLLIALMVYPVSRLISRPIKQLQQSALRIAGGDLDHRAPVGRSRDEIGQLSRAFNHMADRLQQMIHSGRELTANVSHELRSPLARIRVAEELVRDGLDEQASLRLSRHLDRIRDEIGELDSLIGQILDLSKLDLGQAGLNPVPVDLSHLAGQIVDRFRPLAQSRKLNLETDLEPGLVFSVDEEAFRSALTNLIDNAVKFTLEGGRVEVKSEELATRVELSITNTAQALSPADLKSIFEPFHTLAGGIAGQGSGLGLAMVQRIILRLGGSIEAANTYDGLRMRIKLPRKAPSR